MGKKSKSRTKNASEEAESSVGIKRKVAAEDEPPTKRKKDQNWFPGKFVLLKRRSSGTDSEIETTVESKPETNKKKKRQSNGKANGSESQEKSTENGKVEKKKIKLNEESQLAKLCADLSSSDDESWMNLLNSDDDDISFESDSNDEEVGEEWSTDTDYSEGDSLESLDTLEDEDEDGYSFHESDCESVNSNESGNNFNWNDCSTDDSDYKPEIEDKYVKHGEAIFYDGKGLDLAFGNSTLSQIIEINDINPALMDKEVDEEVPDLISPEEVEEENDLSMEQDEDVETEQDADTQQETTETENLSQESEGIELIKDLQIDDGDDFGIVYKQPTECVKFYDCLEDNGVVVKLSNTVHFHGILIIKAMANNVQVNGYTLQANESITATSISRAGYFLNLTPVIERNSSTKGLKNELENILPMGKAHELLDSFKEDSEVILHLQHGIPDPTIEMLKIYSPHALLPSRKMILKSNVDQSSELILSTKFFVATQDQEVETFELNDQWSNVEVKESSKLVIVGGKNVGKSSLCQVIINSNISKFKKFLLIDLDIGQPIFSPAQTVSASLITKPIIGVGYLTRNEPDKCLLYGDKSVMIAPFKYVRCVRQLMEFCSSKLEYKNIPWVINTMGYQKGFGLQLICLLMKILRPTDLIQIQHRIKSYNFSSILTEETVNNFKFNFFDADDVAGLPSEIFFTTHVLDSIVNNRESGVGNKWISNASDKRKLSMLAQLSKILRCTQITLNDIKPFVAPINKIRMLVIDEEYSQDEHGFDIDLLNGNLVYLCEADKDSTLNSTSIIDCYGIGIVRAIDKINEKVYILLPQNENVDDLLAKVNVLAIGNIPLPAEILLKQNLSIDEKIPHITFFKDRKASSKKYINKRNIKDCY